VAHERDEAVRAILERFEEDVGQVAAQFSGAVRRAMEGLVAIISDAPAAPAPDGARPEKQLPLQRMPWEPRPRQVKAPPAVGDPAGEIAGASTPTGKLRGGALLLSIMRARGAKRWTQKEMVEATGSTASAVAQVVGDLVHKGAVVIAAERAPGKGGPKLYHLPGMKAEPTQGQAEAHPPAPARYPPAAPREKPPVPHHEPEQGADGRAVDIGNGRSDLPEEGTFARCVEAIRTRAPNWLTPSGVLEAVRATTGKRELPEGLVGEVSHELANQRRLRAYKVPGLQARCDGGRWEYRIKGGGARRD
jgi:hypothetical protein